MDQMKVVVVMVGGNKDSTGFLFHIVKNVFTLILQLNVILFKLRKTINQL